MPNRPPVIRRKRPARRQGGSTTLRDASAAYKRQRLAILDADPLCVYCRARGHVTPAAILDHILALSLGGTNDRGNLAPACQPCNDEKGKLEARYVAAGYDVRDVMAGELGEWIRLTTSSITPAAS